MPIFNNLRPCLARSIIGRLYRPSLIFVFFVFLLFPSYAQDAKQSKNRPDIFVAPLLEIIGYSEKGLAFGGGLTIGVEDSGYALGLRLLSVAGSDSVNTVELNALIRFYLFNREQHNGFFLQINGGSALSYRDDDTVGSVSVGLSMGKRIPFTNLIFIEPIVRVGYPYMAGVGVVGGIRF
ncbi:MAG: hypothetical protein FWE72_07750 [Spirochaetaceae bacterium]|nr:hypothetical protein [Spirochaetaceae bacterium]